MAVTRVGTDVHDTGDGGDETTSVTIHDDADVIVVVLCGWKYNTQWMSVGRLSFSDETAFRFTNIFDEPWDGETSGGCYVYYMDRNSAYWPGTGAKTLYWGTAYAMGEGPHILIFQYGGVNISGTIINGLDTQTAGSQTGWTSDNLGTGANDMAVIAGYSFDNTASFGSGHSEIYNASFNSATLVCAEEQAEQLMSVSSVSYWLGCAFYLSAEAGGSSASPRPYLFGAGVWDFPRRVMRSTG